MLLIEIYVYTNAHTHITILFWLMSLEAGRAKIMTLIPAHILAGTTRLLSVESKRAHRCVQKKKNERGSIAL